MRKRDTQSTSCILGTGSRSGFLSGTLRRSRKVIVPMWVLPPCGLSGLGIVQEASWYDTFWVSIGLALFVLACAYGWFRNGMAKLRRQKIALENEARERTIELQRANRELERTLQDLRGTQQQLIHQEKLATLGQLTAGIAHEIKNPLNFVNNFASLSMELLDEWMVTKDEEERTIVAGALRGNLERIHQHGKRADGIVKSMMMHARGGSAEKVDVDLHAVLDEAFNLASYSMRALDASFSVIATRRYDPLVSTVQAVQQDLSRVVLNLINNACHAMEARRQREDGFQPALVLESEQRGAEVILRIRDNGGGIPEEIQDKVFNPFFTTKPSGEGTGLGLSICYDIIRKGHDGDLMFTSVEGEGTEFIVTLPAERQA